MTGFVLQPCRIRESRVVPSGAAPLELTARELVARFAPGGAKPDLMKLRALRLGGYVGLARARSSPQKVLFSIWRPDRTNEIDFILKKYGDFPERVEEIHRVLEIDWGSRVEELLSGKKDPLPNTPPRRAALQERV